jgi:hypothetical protein
MLSETKFYQRDSNSGPFFFRECEESSLQLLVNFSLTNVPRCVCHHAKTLGLQHMQFLDVAVSILPAYRACVVRHRMDEQLIKQHTVSGGQATSPVLEGAWCSVFEPPFSLSG